MMIAKSYLGIKKIKAREKLKLIKFFNVFKLCIYFISIWLINHFLLLIFHYLFIHSVVYLFIHLSFFLFIYIFIYLIFFFCFHSFIYFLFINVRLYSFIHFY